MAFPFEDEEKPVKVAQPPQVQTQQRPITQGMADRAIAEQSKYISSDPTKPVIIRLPAGERITAYNQQPADQRQFSYWEKPARVARYYNLIRNADPGWTPPDWLDAQGITEAYNYLRYRNENKPWMEWKALPADDPGTAYLQGLKTPPNEVMLPSEYTNPPLTQQQVQAEQPFGQWDELQPWQQFALGLLAPQTPNIEGRPEGNRFTASVGQSLLAGVGVGLGVGALTSPIGGVIAGLAATGALTYQNYTGNKVPLLNEIMAPFNWLSQGAERAIGVGKQMGTDGFSDVLNDLPSAWKAANATYETQKWDVLNSVFVGGNNALAAIGLAEKDVKAGPNEVWKIEEGISEPVKIEGERGSAALNEGREWIESGKAQTAFNSAVEQGYEGKYADFVLQTMSEKFGFSGTVNDLVLQTIIDPLNVLPYAIGKTGGKMAALAGNQRLAAAFKAGTGNLLIDALPPGVQQLAEGITGVRSSMGLTQIKDIYKGYIRTGYYPASMWEMPDDMRTKFDSLVKSGYAPDAIKVEGNALIWQDSAGRTHTFTGSRAVDFKIPETKDLSSFEKHIGGIDDTYGLKELVPTKNLSFGQKLNKLTVPAQVQVMLNVFHHNISALMDASSGDPTKMIDFFQKAIGNKAIEPGSVGENILKSPAMKAVNEALKYAIRDGDFSTNMLAHWYETEQRRTILTKIADALGETQAKILEQVTDNPEVMSRRLNEIAPELNTTPEVLTETLKTFVGDDAMPWNVEQFQAQVVNTFALKMDNYFKDKLGLAPDHAIFRMSNAMKGVQSLVLLGFNPAYFLNNWINNVVTRAADGVGGYMSPKQITAFYEKFGIFPRDTGLTGFDEITGRVISQAQEANDLISKSQKAISSLNKIGVFTRLSGTIERSEGAQARVIGIKTFMDKTKKVGVGIRKMAPAVEAVLDQQFPGMKERIYAAVNAGVNMADIEKSVYGEYVKPHVESIIDELDQKFTPYAPGATRELLSKTGVIDRLNDRLQNAKTPDDVDNAFADVEADFEGMLNKVHSQDIINRAEEVRNIVTSERIPAVLQLFGDMTIEAAQSWINGRKAWESLYARNMAGEFTEAQWHKEVRLLDAKQQAEMMRLNDHQLQTYKGIVDGLGIDSDFTRGYITKLSDVFAGWKEFWQKRTQLYKEYFQRVSAKENVSWEDLQARIAEYYDKYTQQEHAIQGELDGLFAKGYADFTGWDPTAAAKWRSDLMGLRDQMVAAQKAMREKTKNMSAPERDAEYARFNPLYNKMIADMKQLEHDGAYQLMNKPIPQASIDIPEVERPQPSPNVETPNEAPNGPVDLSKTTASGSPIDDQMRMLGFTDKQIEMLRDDQKIEAIRSNEWTQKAVNVISAKVKAEDIALEADVVKRAALIKSQGLLARQDVETQMRDAFGQSTSEEINAAMLLMDHHADVVARQNGLEPSEATRDVWYASHVAEVTANNGNVDNVEALSAGNKGQISFFDDGRAVIRALRSPDVSTMVHEVGHIFRRDLAAADLDVVARLGGLRGSRELQLLESQFRDGKLSQGDVNYSRYVQAEEKFARAWERYLTEGDAPTPALRAVFRKFTDWMLNIYNKLFKQGGRVAGFEGTELNFDLSQSINGVSLKNIFDRLLVEKVDRAPAYSEMISERMQTLKTTGRNHRFSDLELTARARKEIDLQVLGGFTNEIEARAYADVMQDYLVLPDGSRIDDVAIYDALRDVSPLYYPENAPWNQAARQVEGTTTTARSITDPNKVYDFKFKVIDLDDLQTSDNWQGDKLVANPLYPQELQPRNRAENQSITQVDTIARELVPDELLYDSKALDRGAPIVGSDNNVESGNGRMLALKRAAEMYPEKFAEYQAAMTAALPDYGIDPATLEGMTNPVMVRERVSDVDRVGFVNDGNSRITMGMNATERALNDVGRISDEMLTNLDSLEGESIEAALRSPRNNEFIKRFLEKLPENERGEISSDGIINAQGVDRIINALFAKVYPGAEGERLTRNFTMSLDSNIKTAEAAIMASLPQTAKAEGLIRAGLRSAELSITGDIAAAVDKLASLRGEGKSVGEYLASVNLFGEVELTPNQKMLLKFFSEQRQPKKIRDFLREYANMVIKEPDPAQGVLFGQMNRTKQEILDAAIKSSEPSAEGLFAEPASADATLQDNQLAEPVTGGSGIRESESGRIPDDAAIAAEPIIDTGTAAKLARDADGQLRFDVGIPVEFEKVGDIDLTHSDELPVPYNVQLLIARADTYRFDNKPQAKRYVDWFLGGEKGEMPTVPPIVSNDYAKDIGEMREFARYKSVGVPINQVEIPKTGTFVQKVYKFNHGIVACTANVYKNGELVAYYPYFPSNSVEMRIKNALNLPDGVRVLGVDPGDSNVWVYEDAFGGLGKVDLLSPTNSLKQNSSQGFMGEPGAVEQFREYVEPTIDTQRMSDNPDAPMGRVPLNGTPANEPYARAMEEANSELIRPMLADLRSEYKRRMSDRAIQWGDVDAPTKKQVKKYIEGTVRNDLATTKLAALNYGDQMRNGAMLDYSRRFGIDNVLGTVFPYQFWYTRSMLNWAKRMVDKPSWFAFYTRLKTAQDKMERDGMPTRLKGQVRISMPWMPEWMGGGLWVDPLAKLFPPEQFGQPLEQFQSNQNQVMKRAEYIVEEMLEAEKINQDEAQQAKETKTGSIWSQAVKQAEAELDKSANPASMASMMMSPALWWQLPANLINKTPEKMSPLPVTRTGQTIRELGKDTFMEPVTNFVGGAMALPEESIRENAGLSQFGEWGDYYLDRTLAGMAAAGEISAEDARIAMIQRSGEAFDEATRRVRQEQTLRTPGAAGVMAAKEGANAGQVLKATLGGIFGGSLFSDGELKMRGLKPIYDNAWRELDAGNTDAINKFYDDYPEYAARLALYDQPEERLHQFLIDSIWKKYMELPSANRNIAANALGDDFRNSFLNKETRSYEALDDQVLANWAAQLGSMLPNTEAAKPAADLEMPQYYDQVMIDAIKAFTDERSQRFPTYSMWQSAYFSLPVGAQRKTFLAQHPQLKAYWSWKDDYIEKHPEVEQYFEDLKDDASTKSGGSTAGTTVTQPSGRVITLTADAARKVIQAFKDERNSRFADYKQWQTEYYANSSEADKKAYLAVNPQLQAYWDWKRAYGVSHPEIQPYYAELKAYAQEQTESGNSAILAQFSSEMSAPLIRSLLGYATGSELTSGAKSELDRIRNQIAPNMTEAEFLKLSVSSVIQ